VTAQYLGSFTIGGSIPGAAAVLEQVGNALDGLRIAVQDQIAPLSNVASGLGAQVDAIGAAKAAIRIPAVADLQIQLDAALDLAVGFEVQLTDPITYINGLLSGLAQVSANLAALVPPDLAISGQLAATAAIAAQMGLKIEAIDVQLAALDSIVAAVNGFLSIVAAVQAALNAAIAGVAAALAAFLDLAAKLDGAAGAHCFVFDGDLGDLGAAIDAVSGDAGIGAAVPVRVPFVVVRADDASTVEGLEAVYRLS
jgi:hypothetical protein